MAFSDKSREPRAPSTPRKARPRLSLKMQAIGFLSRREHSRQELRAKLLDSLRKRTREDAALEAAAEKAAHELAEALREQPSNGIDDAFAPSMSSAPPAPAFAPGRERGAHARASRARAERPARAPATTRAALDTLSFADGAALPVPLRARIAAAAEDHRAEAAGIASAGRPEQAPASRAGLVQDVCLDDEVVLAQLHAAVDAGSVGVMFEPSKPAADDVLAGDDLERVDPEAAVDQLLDWLAANNYLSETRFVESRVNARSRKQGTLRIKLELSRHGLALEPELAATLRETEFARAQSLWQRKFGEVAPDARLRAKQARFLAARGCAAEVVRRVVGGEEED